MTKTFCDICGAELTPETTAQFHNEFGVNHKQKYAPNILYCANIHDLCKQCAEVGAEIDVVATMRKFWQERVSKMKVADAINHYREVKASHDQS